MDNPEFPVLFGNHITDFQRRPKIDNFQAVVYQSKS